MKSAILGCINCNKEVQQLLYDNDFLPNLFTIISGFLILGVIVMAFAYFHFNIIKNIRVSIKIPHF